MPHVADFTAGAATAVRRCADLINAAREPGDDALRAALDEHGEDGGALSTDDVAALRTAAGELRAIAEAATLEDAVARINEHLGAGERPRLSAHDGSPWHLHTDAPGASWGPWLRASSAMALAITVAETQRRPLDVCAASGCDRVFVAAGRGRPRRYCSETCATRDRAAKFRARHRGE